MLSFILWGAGAGVLASVGLVAAVRNWARRRLLLDHPSDRSLHVSPTPRGGGIGIVLPVCLALAAVAVLAPDTRAAVAWVGGTGLLIAAVGLVDDMRGLSPVTRLLVHASAAGLIALGIGTWRILLWPGLSRVDLGWLAIPFTVLLVAGFTNAYNFMDGIDGIAGSQAAIAGFGWIGAGYALQDPLVVAAGTVLAAANLGFLFFNWPPASIFMGDVGSSFLGFVLAVLSVLVARQSPAIAMAGMLFVWPFVFDTVFTFLRRLGRREHLLRPHRTHLYQRLVLTGVSHRAVTLLYTALATIGLAVGHAVAREATFASAAGASLIGVLAAALWFVVVRRERSVGLSPGPAHRRHF